MKKYVIFFFVWCGVWWAYEEAADNFHMRHCYPTHWPEVKVSAVSANKLELARDILSQPFSYLGKGRQFYAFLSQDQKYVLKLIKCQRFNTLPWTSTLQPERFCYKKQQFEKLFSSCHIAANELADITAILFVHLVPFAETKVKVTLIDKLGLFHKLDIDKVPFLLQTYVAKSSTLHTNEQQLISTLAYETAKRGFIDTDSGGLERGNIGFLEGKAVYIDVGTFCPLSSYNPHETL